ncbi:PAS domain S-box-containing protein/diguanylate cyclase (GGDEF) domain-containing protein [Noviherbaspirillum humi]|uniref:PAS domain S-box-containing protein/diguanylate cyclase (GGDEF) domain-containing protein n=1 Tax=Noviherbaspirillum humi TaxID=1688639 RepID=A0A239KK21_9BURK|nr:EAL domain-containing protein [Noviherbaspirillum humi]SNT18042.1 PAS domain S-box-containing protein/diguanylate cyclase (GGDEF) domain-containing protein [Noviherbaspirillum humi]
MHSSNWFRGTGDSPLRSFAMAVLIVLPFAFAQYAARTYLGFRAPLGLLIPPVMICVVFGGWRPAVLATVTSLGIGAFFLMEPRYSFAVASTEDRAVLVVFSFICSFMSLMGGMLERAERKAGCLMRSLQESEQTMRALLQATTQAALGVGQDGLIRFANEAVRRLFGYAPEELIGRPVWVLVPEGLPELQPQDLEAFFAASRTGYTSQVREVKARDKHGRLIAAEASLGMADTPSGPLAVTFVADITRRKEAEERIIHAARHDPLTGLPNRALIYELGAHALVAASRADRKVAMLFFDLDRFKPINDTYGHETGDRMLQEVARRLKAAVRASDVVGRLGGDEFIAILTDMQTEADVTHTAAHLLQSLGQPCRIGELELATSPSIGISLYPADGRDIDTLIRHADAAMYHAKGAGRNNFQFFTAEINDHAEHAFMLEQRLREALRRGEFELAYQPVLDTRSMRVVGAEALVRWKQEDAPSLPPAEFIAAAETSGLIHQIGDWVLAEACRQHDAWRRQGLPPLRIAVNVSPVQFRAKHFRRRVAEMLAGAGIDPACVELEVTEATVMKQVEQAARTLAGLKELGVRITLDDFGTGYSCLGYLSQIPIDKLKVDQSFVRRISDDPHSLAIADAVITLGKRLGTEVVAEGIESEQALDLLRQRECDHGQGYLFSRPLTGAQFATWCRDHDARRVLH